VYPYERKLHWWLRGRARHLVDGLEAEPDLFSGARGAQLQRRLVGLRRWMLVRLIALTILSFSIIGGATTMVIEAAGGSAEASQTLAFIMRIASSLVGLATIVYFLSNRMLGVLEIDALMLANLQVRQ
jgi:hypothetical protein